MLVESLSRAIGYIGDGVAARERVAPRWIGSALVTWPSAPTAVGVCLTSPSSALTSALTSAPTTRAVPVKVAKNGKNISGKRRDEQ